MKTWTLRALKKHFDSRFKALDKAVGKAEDSTEKRFASVNEFRSTLSDQARDLMPRKESESIFASHNEKNEAMFVSLDNKIDEVRKDMDRSKNVKQGSSNMWISIVAVVTFLIALITIIMTVFKKFP